MLNLNSRAGAGRRWVLPLITLGLGACAGGPGNDPTSTAGGPFDGIGSLNAPLLAAACTTTASGLAIVVGDNESAYVTLRPNDNKVTLNANLAGGAPCVLNTTQTLAITATGNTAHTVILDYVNGIFMKAATTPLMTIDLSIHGANTVKIRGSNVVDRYALGAGTGGANAFNVNSGTAMTVPAGDAIADVTWKNVQTVVVSTGPGADDIEAQGVFGTGAAYPGVLKLYGGPNDDTITGGAGADYIVGGDDNDTMDGNDGNDTFYMAVASDGTDIINVASATPGNKTVDYSGRTNALTLNIDGSNTSGEGVENDKISDKVVTVLAGSGNDTITVGATSTVAHVIKGGAGNDTITGGLGADAIDGQAGDDVVIGDHCTADYSSRATNITVTVCNGACLPATNANDGDQTASLVQHSGVGASAGAPDVTTKVSVITLGAGFTTLSVGRNLVVTAPLTNAGTFPITAYTSGTSVSIDTTTQVNFVAAATTVAWAEQGAEKDNVQCINVSGGTLVDTITGDSRNNLIWGNDGNDVLTGGTGDDSLWGGNGGDTLYGGAGADSLNGEDGTDTLVGGDDNDILSGGPLADSFTCNGKNDSVAVGTHAGDSDFTIDFSPLGDMDTGALDCAF